MRQLIANGTYQADHQRRLRRGSPETFSGCPNTVLHKDSDYSIHVLLIIYGGPKVPISSDTVYSLSIRG